MPEVAATTPKLGLLQVALPVLCQRWGSTAAEKNFSWIAVYFVEAKLLMLGLAKGRMPLHPGRDAPAQHGLPKLAESGASPPDFAM